MSSPRSWKNLAAAIASVPSQSLAAFCGTALAERQVHPTFLGAQGPAFPNVGYAVEGANWSYVKLLGDVRTPRRALTPGEGQEEFKRLGLHYLRLTPWEPLTISVGEAFIYTAPFDGDIFYNTLPILPYWFTKYLPGIKTRSTTACSTVMPSLGCLRPRCMVSSW